MLEMIVIVVQVVVWCMMHDCSDDDDQITEYKLSIFFNLFFFLYSRHIYTPEKKCIWYDTSDPGNDPKKTLSNIEREREKYNVIFQKHGFRQFMVVVVSRSVCLSDNVMWYLGKKRSRIQNLFIFRVPAKKKKKLPVTRNWLWIKKKIRFLRFLHTSTERKKFIWNERILKTWAYKLKIKNENKNSKAAPAPAAAIEDRI